MAAVEHIAQRWVSTGLINPCSAGAATPAAGDGSCGRRCRHPVGHHHSHSTSRTCVFPPRAQPQRHKARTKLQEANLGWISPSTLEKGPHGSAEGSQGVHCLHPSPAHPKLPLLPHPHRGSSPAASWFVWPLGLGGFTAHPGPCSSIPHRSTYMAHCSFSFLMEPYSACREKSRGVSRRAVPGWGVCSVEQRRHARLAQGYWRLR